MTTSGILQFAGLVGVILYIGSYAALQLGFLRGSGYAYAFANLAASALVLLSLTAAFNLSSAIIQVVWIAISAVGITRMYWLSRRAQLDADEEDLIARMFPAMSRTMARVLLDAGAWHRADAGTRLTTEGEVLGALIYLAEGEADVLHGAQVIGHCPPASFIGELTCFDRTPAVATVVLTSPARYFRVGSEALDQLCARNFEMRQILHHAIGGETRRKLIEANRRLRKLVHE